MEYKKQEFLKNLENIFIEKMEKLSENVFNKKTVQTLMFCNLLSLHIPENTSDTLSKEKTIKKFFVWQSNSVPKMGFLSFSGYLFNHENDLNWNECIEAENKFKELEKNKGEKEDLEITDKDLNDPFEVVFSQKEKLENE